METPKQKAKQLVDKYYFDIYVWDGNGYYVDKILSNDTAKRNAVIAVDEILDNFGLTTNGQTFYTEYRAVEFYTKVKTEIEKKL
jgi:hypothetical protein